MKFTVNTEQWQSEESSLQTIQTLLALILVLSIAAVITTIFLPRWANAPLYFLTSAITIVTIIVDRSIEKHKKNKITEVVLSDSVNIKEK